MSRDLGAEYWNSRYRAQETGWDAGQITSPLKAYIDQLKDIQVKILIPGAGNAYEAEYLVQQGFANVYVCDIAPLPLENLQKRCPSFKKEQLLLADFFKLEENGFGLILEQTFFCALDPSLRPRYFQQVRHLLAPGGRLAGVLFNDPLNTDRPPFGGSKEEYLGYAGALFTIRTFEPCYNSIKPREGRELFINLEK